MLILISSDNYLMFGLKGLFPSLMHVSDVKQIIHECVLLIDNRDSLQYLSDAHNRISVFAKKHIPVRLDMNGKESLLISSDKSKSVSMNQGVTGVHFDITDILIKPPCYSEMMVDMTINEKFKSILNCFLEGTSMEDISKLLCCSQKTIYRYRYEVSKQMGYRNFHHACRYIFKNNLMIDSVVLPRDWLM